MKLLILILTLFSFNANAAIEKHVKDGGNFGSTILTINTDNVHGQPKETSGHDTVIFSKKSDQNYCTSSGYNPISSCTSSQFPYDHCPRDHNFVKLCIEKSLLIYNKENCAMLTGYIWKNEYSTSCGEDLEICSTTCDGFSNSSEVVCQSDEIIISCSSACPNYKKCATNCNNTTHPYSCNGQYESGSGSVCENNGYYESCSCTQTGYLWSSSGGCQCTLPPIAYECNGANESGVGNACQGKYASCSCSNGIAWTPTDGCDIQTFCSSACGSGYSSTQVCSTGYDKETCTTPSCTSFYRCVKTCDIADFPLSSCPTGYVCETCGSKYKTTGCAANYSNEADFWKGI